MSCDICVDTCAKIKAISKIDENYILDQEKCKDCGACIDMCLAQAIGE